MTRYKNIFTVSFLHRYFSSEYCNRLSLVPLPQTALLISKAGLKSNLSNGTYQLACPTSEKVSLIDTVKHIKVLRFFLTCSDPLFFNYSDLPFLQDGELFAFSNASSEYLSASDLASDQDVRAHRLPYFKLNADEIKDGMEVSLKMTDDSPIGIEKEADVTEIAIDLRYEEEGAYELKNGDEVLEEWVVASALPKGCIGIIELDLRKYGEEDFPVKFELKFNARETFWKYYFVNRNKKKVGGLKVANGKANIEFSEQEKYEMMTGEEATVMASEQSIALNEVPSQRFHLQLLDEEGKAKNHPRMILPNASAKAIKQSGAGEERKIYSEIYVYI